ncbi:MAG: hypothetical protein M3O71_16370 [Bacteroidota bacterium]|nr:hypothetical protein [Bacteroidota bacterium]
MKKLIYVSLGLLLLVKMGYAQTNVELIDQLVTESQSEHDRQTSARTNQATVTANEDVNKSQMTTLKTTYRNIQSRFHTLGLVIDAGEIGLEAAPLVNEIVSQQKLIIAQCEGNPILILLAVNSEADLADQATLLTEYCAGLILSIGDVNQMKASDRKMLFSYVVSELRRIDGASRGLLNSIINFNNQLHSKSGNPFGSFINQDKSLVDDIMRNAKALK